MRQHRDDCDAQDIEVTAFGSAKRITVSGGCSCPLPVCFLCAQPVDDGGRCTTTLCPLDGLLVPIPDMV